MSAISLKPFLLICRLRIAFVSVFAISLTVLLAPAYAAETFPANLAFADSSLVKQGVGTRKKAFISLYKAGLYLNASADDGATISAADEPMAIRLSIVSGFITSKKMNDAMMDGFNKSTGGNIAPIESEIAQFASGFSDEIKKKDIFDLVYTPGVGVKIVKNSQNKVTVPGLAFKQALFAIWLSDDPVQASLKKDMLGGK